MRNGLWSGDGGGGRVPSIDPVCLAPRCLCLGYEVSRIVSQFANVSVTNISLANALDKVDILEKVHHKVGWPFAAFAVQGRWCLLVPAGASCRPKDTPFCWPDTNC